MNWNTYYDTLYNSKKYSNSLKALCVGLYYENLKRKEKKWKIKYIENVIKNIFMFIKKSTPLSKMDYDLIFYIDSFERATYSQIKGVLELALKNKDRVLIMCRKKIYVDAKMKEYMERGAYVLNLDNKYFKGNIKESVKGFKVFFHLRKILPEIGSCILLEFSIKNNYYEKNLEEILKKSGAASIFQGYDSDIINANLILKGREYKNKEYTIQHGNPEMTKDKDDRMSIITRNYVVWGEKSKEIFSSKTKDCNFYILGNPNIDVLKYFLENKNKINIKIRKKLRINEDEKILLFMSQTHHIPEKKYQTEIVKGLKNIIKDNRYKLVVKFHPSEDKKMYESILKKEELDKIIFLKNEYPLYELLTIGNVIASPYSTALLEAMAFEIPCFQLNFGKLHLPSDYSIEHGCKYVDDSVKFPNIITEYLENETKRVELVARQNLFVDMSLTNVGRATEKIYDLIRWGKYEN
jgi:hypothetical protein